MAIGKRVKIGGGHFLGSKVAINAASGEYTKVLTTTDGAAVNGMTITPDAYGAGDTMKIEHYADAAGTGRVMALIATGIPNMGRLVPIALDFPAAEKIGTGESLVFTYLNTASVAMNVHLITEYIGLRKTA